MNQEEYYEEEQERDPYVREPPSQQLSDTNIKLQLMTEDILKNVEMNLKNQYRNEHNVVVSYKDDEGKPLPPLLHDDGITRLMQPLRMILNRVVGLGNLQQEEVDKHALAISYSILDKLTTWAFYGLYNINLGDVDSIVESVDTTVTAYLSGTIHALKQKALTQQSKILETRATMQQDTPQQESKFNPLSFFTGKRK